MPESLSKNELVMSHIISKLKGSNEPQDINLLYENIIQSGKFRNFLTSNRWNAIIQELIRSGTIDKQESTVKLIRRVRNLSQRDILARIIMKGRGVY